MAPPRGSTQGSSQGSNDGSAAVLRALRAQQAKTAQRATEKKGKFLVKAQALIKEHDAAVRAEVRLLQDRLKARAKQQVLEETALVDEMEKVREALVELALEMKVGTEVLSVRVFQQAAAMRKDVEAARTILGELRTCEIRAGEESLWADADDDDDDDEDGPA